MDAIPLATKPPTIVDLKIVKEGKKSYYMIIRADGQSRRYITFAYMLKEFDREDLETLWALMKRKYGANRPDGDYERVLYGDLKTMFDPDVEDEVWKLQQNYKVLSWKLFDFCGEYCLTLQARRIYMLVEKRYPLTIPIINQMLEKKLQVDQFNEMAYQLCKLMKKQQKNKGGLLGIKGLLLLIKITAVIIQVTTVATAIWIKTVDLMLIVAAKLKEIQDGDTPPAENSIEHLVEAESFETLQEDVALVCRSISTYRAPERLWLNVEVEEHSPGDLNEPANYKDALLDLESNNWLDAMNA
ncbi:hypothetical protein Tco_0932090 [Tanacetum coccineum]